MSSITGELQHSWACLGGVGRWPCVTEPSSTPRWLAYLLFFILVLTVCLLACLGLAKHSRCLLVM